MVYLFKASPRRTWCGCVFLRRKHKHGEHSREVAQVWHTHSQDREHACVRACACMGVGVGVHMCAGRALCCDHHNSHCPALWNLQKYTKISRTDNSATGDTQVGVSSVFAAVHPSQRLLECFPHPQEKAQTRQQPLPRSVPLGPWQPLICLSGSMGSPLLDISPKCHHRKRSASGLFHHTSRFQGSSMPQSGTSTPLTFMAE